MANIDDEPSTPEQPRHVRQHFRPFVFATPTPSTSATEFHGRFFSDDDGAQPLPLAVPLQQEAITVDNVIHCVNKKVYTTDEDEDEDEEMVECGGSIPTSSKLYGTPRRNPRSV